MKTLIQPALGLSLALLLSACVSNPQVLLENQLAALPAAPAEAGQSLAQTSVESILANSNNPNLIVAVKGQTLKFEDYERQLTAVRQPASENTAAMRSLSYYASQSLLESCNQVCGLKISQEQGVPGQFMTFNCDEQILNIRDYYPSAGKQGFTLPRERVNLLIDGAPAWLARHQGSDGTGSTFLAWQGADRGFALFSADATDATASKLLALAQSLAKVKP